MQTLHEKRMLDLIEFTRIDNDCEPYGSSIYDQYGKLLVSVTANTSTPINHAETYAINECARLFPDVQWNQLTLYTTGEPCCMCAAACCWANLKEVVYATNIPFMTTLWGIEGTLRAIDVIKTHPKAPNVIAGVCEEECNQLFLDRKQAFFDSWNKKRWPLST